MNSPVSYIGGLSPMDSFEMERRVRNRILALNSSEEEEEELDGEFDISQEEIII